MEFLGLLAARFILAMGAAVFGDDGRFDWSPEDDAEYETLCRSDH